MNKDELLKELGELQAKMCIEAGCKTNGECMDFLEDNGRGLNTLKLSKFFMKFEPSKNNINEIKRLNKISQESKDKLKELKNISEELELMNCQYGKENIFNMNYYKGLLELENKSK